MRDITNEIRREALLAQFHRVRVLRGNKEGFVDGKSVQVLSRVSLVGVL